MLFLLFSVVLFLFVFCLFVVGVFSWVLFVFVFVLFFIRFLFEGLGY